MGKELAWEAVVPIPLVPEVTYRYAVVNEALEAVKWEHDSHTVALPSGLEDGAIVSIADEWVDAHPGRLLSRAAFTRVILAGRPAPPPRAPAPLQPAMNEAIVRLQVWDREVLAGQEVCVTGGAPQLGNWQLPQVVRMAEARAACWEVELSIPLKDFPVTYKFAVRDARGALTLEHGESRILALPASDSARAPALLVRHDGYFRRERRWRGAGVAVPVFSLRTAASVGCGEFADLAPMARWCAAAGLRLLQVLPVADTSVRCSWRDSYPYSSLCVFALHPMYLRLEALAGENLHAAARGANKKKTRLRCALGGGGVWRLPRCILAQEFKKMALLPASLLLLNPPASLRLSFFFRRRPAARGRGRRNPGRPPRARPARGGLRGHHGRQAAHLAQGV